MHIHVHTHITHTHAHTLHTHAHTHMHTHTYAHTMHTHTHISTHMHTHTQGKGFYHITYKFLSYLDNARSLCRAEQVCREWCQVIGEGLLWKKLIEKTVKTSGTIHVINTE